MKIFDFFKKAASVLGWLLTVAGVVITIVYAENGWQRAFWLSIIVNVLFLVTIIIVIFGYLKLSKEYSTLKDTPPAENSCYAEVCYPEGDKWYIVTNRSEMYRQDSVVVLYYYNGRRPKRIGYGRLYNYDNQKQYIEIKHIFEDAGEEFDKLKANDYGYLKNTYVMPIIFGDDIPILKEIF